MAAPWEDTLGKSESTEDNFKPIFKLYKQRKAPPDLSDVIDFDNISNEKVKELFLNPKKKESPWGILPLENWKLYTHVDFPGFTFIRNPFLDGAQLYWIKRCLECYPNKPNITNLDAHMYFEPDFSIWKHSRAERQKVPLEKTLLWKLRWSTLGYHHNWNTKKYSADSLTSIPDDLQTLSKYIAEQLGWPEYLAEAVIVNYYHSDSTLAGHTDHSELDLQAPLISISFGQSALFMIGGSTKATKPITMFVRSGDIIVMEGPARLAYHAVPKVFMDTCDFNSILWQLPASQLIGGATRDDQMRGGFVKHDTDGEYMPGVTEDNLGQSDLLLYQEYLAHSRINMNVRQVNPRKGLAYLFEEIN